MKDCRDARIVRKIDIAPPLCNLIQPLLRTGSKVFLLVVRVLHLHDQGSLLVNDPDVEKALANLPAGQCVRVPEQEKAVSFQAFAKSFCEGVVVLILKIRESQVFLSLFAFSVLLFPGPDCQVGIRNLFGKPAFFDEPVDIGSAVAGEAPVCYQAPRLAGFQGNRQTKHILETICAF